MRFIIILILLKTPFIEALGQDHDPSWSSIEKLHKGKVKVYWYQNEPFTYIEPQNKKLTGLEVEIMQGFQSFLLKRYQVDLSIQWIQLNSFQDVMDKMKNPSESNCFSLGGFSISPERRKFMKFSPSYMADIAVLVSTEDIPVVNSKKELKKYLKDATAIIIPGTLMESDILEMKTQEQLNFKVKHTSNSLTFLDDMRHTKRAFGYLSLPVYLMNLNQTLINLKRQNYFTQKKEGHGIGMPKASDWEPPMNSYFESTEFKKENNTIIANYINLDLYNFINESNSESNISLLNKEKDLQLKDIKLKGLIIQKDAERQIILFGILVVVTGLFILVVILFRKNHRDHRKLKEQKEEVEAQSEEIKSINDNLEIIIQERTKDLLKKNQALNEYSKITSSSLTIPAINIKEAIKEIKPQELKGEQEIIFYHLQSSAKNLEEVISSLKKDISPPRSSSPTS